MKRLIIVAMVVCLAIAGATPLVAGFCKRCDNMEARTLSSENYICPGNSTCPRMRYVIQMDCHDKAWNEQGNSNCTDSQSNPDKIDYYNIDYAWSNTNCNYKYLGKKGAGGDVNFDLFETKADLSAQGYTYVKTVDIGSCECYDGEDDDGQPGLLDCYPFE